MDKKESSDILNDFIGNFIKSQIPPDLEFTKTVNDNYWSLIEKSNKDDNPKKVVAIEYVDWLNKELNEINKIDLSDMTLTKGGVALNISKESIDDFKYTGLSNEWFILDRFWESEFEDI